jgi:hypothetical protein
MALWRNSPASCLPVDRQPDGALEMRLQANLGLSLREHPHDTRQRSKKHKQKFQRLFSLEPNAQVQRAP